MKVLGVAAVCAVLVVGCSPKAETADAAASEAGRKYDAALAAYKAIKPDGSTPDRALKSIWALRDGEDVLSCAANALLHSRAQTRELAGQVDAAKTPDGLVAGDVASVMKQREASAGACHRDQFERDIRDVKIETESRAVIIARIRNVTPAPEGAEPDAYEREQREKGETYRYILSKGSDGGWKLEDIWSVDGVLGERSLYGSDMTKPHVPILVWPL